MGANIESPSETILGAVRLAPWWRTGIVTIILLFLLAGAVGITYDGITAFIDGVTGRRDIGFGWFLDSLFAIWPTAVVCVFRRDVVTAIRFLLLAAARQERD